ncbi:hypothetical protein HOY80DRAFT_1026158 [Tuber brumale]|nr:hypothetical protein HOY80DRAFT_1026158 [Tuber brumale]
MTSSRLEAKSIHKFRGDPKKVTLWRQSDSAGSIIARLSPVCPISTKKKINTTRGAVLILDDIMLKESRPSSYSRCLAGDWCGKRVLEHTPTSNTWTPAVHGELLMEWIPTVLAAGRINGEYELEEYNAYEGENFAPLALWNPTSSDS